MTAAAPLRPPTRGQHRKTNVRSIQPHRRARGRRGHAHALVAAEGAASRRRPVAAGACAGAPRPKAPMPRLAVVIGPDHEAVADEAKRIRPDAATFVQRERLGTAHAVLAAREAIARGADDLLVVFGDTPLISAETFARLRAPLRNGRGACRARLSRRRSHRLWPAAGRGRPAGRDPRTRRRQRRSNARSSSATPA